MDTRGNTKGMEFQACSS